MKSIFSTGRKALMALVTVAALLVTGGWANAQSVIRGKVLDSTGEAIIGASVVVPGTTNGVITDIDGNFELRVAPRTVLEVSCIGYVTQRVEAANNMSVTLQDDKLMLEEAVAVGYGTMKKSDVTGAMVSVTSEQLVANPVNNAVEALQGKAAGVVVSTAGIRPGSVGSITVRGVNGTSSRSPLVVIDGIVGESVGLDMINPQDIESIDVLKDASATAIYGARGGAGVILVTTKRGKNGRLSLNYSGVATFEKIYDLIPMMNAQEYIEWRRWGYYYAGLGPRADQPNLANDRKLFTAYGTDETAWANILKGWGLSFDQFSAMSPEQQTAYSGTWDGSKVTSTDWTQFTDRIGITQEHTLSVSGGTDKMNAYLSIGYLNQTGTNIGQAFDRYTIRASVDINPVAWFKMGGALNARFSDQEYGIDSGNGISGSIPSSLHAKGRNIFSYALPYDMKTGERIIYPGGDTTIPTVVDEVGNSAISNLEYQLTASLYGELNFGQMWKPLEGLTFRTTFGPQFRFSQGYRYLDNESVNRVSQGLDYVSSNASKRFSWTLDNILSYNRIFGDHSFNVTLLQEAVYRMNTTLYSMSGTGVALGMTQTWWGLNSQSVETLNAPSYNSLTESQMASYMARVNYSWKDRYIATVSYRYDGASQLGVGHKWAGFPSIALAWRIDQEPWFHVNWLDQLKLRTGWGRSGNYNVAVYFTKDVLTSGNVVLGSQGSTQYYTSTTFANQSIGWETTDSFNVGLDFSVLKGRLSGVLDVYRNRTHDLLFNVSLPSVSGYTGTQENVGEVLNNGFDFTLNTVNINKRNFSWRTDINLSYTKNKILELQSGKEDMVGSLLFIGQPTYVSYGYKSAGLWSDSAEDLAEMAKFNANGHNFSPGMVKPVDQNGDYQIEGNYDRVILGTTRPLWNFGMNNTFRYKNLELAVFIYGAFKYFAQTGQYQGGREPVISMNYYNENNKVGAEYQRPFFNTAGGDSFSGIALQSDASFLKVRQISLGYNLPRSFVQTLGLSNVKVTAQLKNPFSIYQGTSWMDSDLGSGTITKGCVFGVNVSF